MRAQPEGSHYIDGAFVDGEGERHPSLDPARVEPIAEIAWATEAEIERAIEAAKAGLSVWRKAAPAERAAVLLKAADILRRDNRPLSELETLDTGKPLQETLVADAASGADCLAYFGARAATLTGEQIPFAGSDGGFCLHQAGAPWGVRRYRCLELSDPDRLLEGGPSTRLRQCHDLQAFRSHTAFRPGARGRFERGRIAKGGFQTSSKAAATSVPPWLRTPISPRSRSPARSAPAPR